MTTSDKDVTTALREIETRVPLWVRDLVDQRKPISINLALCCDVMAGWLAEQAYAVVSWNNAPAGWWLVCYETAHRLDATDYNAALIEACERMKSDDDK